MVSKSSKLIMCIVELLRANTVSQQQRESVLEAMMSMHSCFTEIDMMKLISYASASKSIGANVLREIEAYFDTVSNDFDLIDSYLSVFEKSQNIDDSPAIASLILCLERHRGVEG